MALRSTCSEYLQAKGPLVKSHHRLLGKFLLAFFVGVASLPLAFVFADSIFGMASALVVPVFVVSLLFTVISHEPVHRMWWFAFACSTAIWLIVLSPIIESGIHGNHEDMIYQFAYAEADTEEALPLNPLPIKAYVNATWQMIDGTPK